MAIEGTNGVAVAQKKMAPKKPSRMTLSSIVRGKIARAPRVVVYGTDGIGKSTFAADAPGVIFLCAESGTDELDVARFPKPNSWTEALEAIDTLQREEHDFANLAIDTIDWLEQLCKEHVCEKNGWNSITQPGYGKGPDAVLCEWMRLLNALERLNTTRNIGIFLLAHDQLRKAKNPNGDDFERWQLDLLPEVASKTRQWSTAVLFAQSDIVTAKKDGRVKGFDTGKRLLRTVGTAAWDAKNRYGLPEEILLSYADFTEALKGARPTGEQVRDRITDLLASVVDEALVAKVNTAVEAAGDDIVELERIEDRLVKLRSTEEQQ